MNSQIWTNNPLNNLTNSLARILFSTSRFSVEQIASFQKKEPNGLVVVHPECSKEVVEAADAVGSTEFIRNFVKQSQDDAKIAIGTEINMVARLNNEYPNKEIECLDTNVCPCSTMYMIHPLSPRRF